MPAQRPGRAFLTYNVARLALFGVCLGIGWAIGLTGLPLLIFGFAVSGLASLFLLGRQRMQITEGFEGFYRETRRRIAARQAAEDEAVDRLVDSGSGRS